MINKFDKQTNTGSSPVLAKNLAILTKSTDLLKSYIRYKRQHHLKESIDHYHDILKSVMVTKGIPFSIEWNKQIRLDTLRYLAGTPLPIKESRKIWIRRQHSTGLPKILGPLIPIIKAKEPESIRIVLSLLYITRGFISRSEPDYSTITEGEDPNIHKGLISFIEEELSDLVLEKSQLAPIYPHLSTSMGPNGPATLTATDDLKYLDMELKHDLYYLANDEEGGLGKYFALQNPVSLGKAKADQEPCLRKLSEVDDKEGKKRLVAIFDYWSQTVLKPLHTLLNSVLKGGENDCTFNQSNFKSILTDPEVLGETIYSIDLKAATDRMPALLQAHILGVLMDDEAYGQSGLRVMTDRGFSCPDGETRAYAQGQPMGAYSSWPMMAITHHIIIRFAFKLARQEPKYYVLGDDALIVGDVAFKAYRAVCSSLNMEVNESKTFGSKDFLEFAKRYFLKGVEVTPFPIGAVLSSRGDAGLMAVGIDNALTKSLLSHQEVSGTRIIGFFAEIFKILDASEQQSGTRAKRLKEILLLMQLKRGGENDGITDRPYGLNQFKLSCSRSDKGVKGKLAYAGTQCLSDLAKELYQSSMVSYQMIEQRLFEYEDLFQPSSDGELPETMMVPIGQVTQHKVNILAEIANAQYDINKTVPELLAQGGGGAEELSYVLPDGDTFDNRKGSARRAQTNAKLARKFKTFLKEWYGSTV